MRKILLLTALCMAMALVFAPMAMAQSASADPCPDPEFPRETPDGCQASDLPDVEFGSDATASPSASASASASAAAEPVSCEEFVALASGEFSQYQAQQFYDFVATPEQQAALDPDGNGFACDDGEIGGDDSSASASASASASVTELPETGGPSPAAFALPSLALLVAGGIFAARLVRR